MTRTVLDSSAVLAYINNEPGADVVERALSEALLSTVNLSEVVARLTARGIPRSQIRLIMDALDLDVADFDAALAEEAGILIAATVVRGLSLGDRACLALAGRENLAVLTADRAWDGLAVDVSIQLIR